MKTSGIWKPSRRGLVGASLAASTAGVAAGVSRASWGADPWRQQEAWNDPPQIERLRYDVPRIDKLERVRQKLVAPPHVPEHEQVAPPRPRVIEIEMTVEEKRMVVSEADDAEVWAFTYNGTVPGPLVVCHVDDYVELTLKSHPDNLLEHNIDFHASTGALGGGALTLIQPGEEVVLRFRAVKAGCFVYHCAPGGEMVPYHCAHGMNGAIMVLPRQGLYDARGNPIIYDRAYYIGEQDYYLPRDSEGNYRKYRTALDDYADSIEAMKTLTPSHIVLNGAVGALTGKNAMPARVGERVLIIHAQSNRNSAPHLIGGHGDYVWETGSFADPPTTGLETWYIRAGSAGAAHYTFRQPGVYAYLNHNLIEAFLLGAVAHFKVEGEWNNDLMEQVKKPTRMMG